MSKVVEVKQLTKRYSDVTAVDGVSFSLEENKIYGLLGRNGAGKTTIMQMLTAQIFPTSGEMKVFGEEPYENNHVLRQICFIRESQKYPSIFRVQDVLDISERLFPNWDREYAYSLVEEFRLPLKRSISKLSRGMLSSVGIIVGLASRAPLTIFDEPYLGLDAVARNIFYDHLLEDYSEYPRTIILSTHLIDEVSKLLEHIILIESGKIILDEEADTLRGYASKIIGSVSKVDAFVTGKQVIHRESLGSQVATSIVGPLDTEERNQAQMLGLEIVPLSLQQLIIHLTNNTTTRKAVLIHES